MLSGATYNVSSDHFAVEVELDSAQVDRGTKTLRLTAEKFLVVGSGQSVRVQNLAGGIFALGDVVEQGVFDKLFARLLMIVRDVLKGLVHRYKERVVGRGAVEQIHHARVVVD